MKYITSIGGQEFVIDINDDGHIQVDGERLDIDFQGLPDTQLYSVIINGESYEVGVDDNEESYNVLLKNMLYEVKVEDERTRRLAGLLGKAGSVVGEALVKSPMPGIIVSIPVEENQEVDEGDVIIILESMKMQNEFKAPKAGVISSIRVAPGDRVNQNEIMITIS